MTLLDDIENFLVRHGMSATALGAAAISDRHFVRQLRLGRRCWPETEGRVREFMNARDAELGGTANAGASPGMIGESSGEPAAAQVAA